MSALMALMLRRVRDTSAAKVGAHRDKPDYDVESVIASARLEFIGLTKLSSDRSHRPVPSAASGMTAAVYFNSSPLNACR
jgi:hypothetical protein